MDFRDIDYLKSGNPRQRKAYAVLTQHAVLTQLAAFSPILVGTIPIGIDVATSDLDIVCHWEDAREFEETLFACFSKHTGFRLSQKLVRGEQAVIARFEVGGFEIEVFGQSIPANRQHAYRHMLIEAYLLRTRGDAFRKTILELRKQGLKTEPAFAKALGLEGDPYLALLTFEQEM